MRPSSREAAAEGPRNVVVTETRMGTFQQAIEIGPHRLTADEPVAAGGLDSGPGPYDLLLAGLGACTSMTLRLYAEHKKLPLERVSVTLSHSKIHAADCADCETKEGKIDRIERVVTLTGALSDEQRARLLEIADKCPVHRTLTSEIDIRTVENQGRKLKTTALWGLMPAALTFAESPLHWVRRQQRKGGDPVSHCLSPRSPALWILASYEVSV